MVFVKDNNPRGCHGFTVSARDRYAQENVLLMEQRVDERALSSYVSVHAESGKLYALQRLDHEELELLQFQVRAREAGMPPLGSSVTLQVLVLERQLCGRCWRLGWAGGAVSELVPHSVGAGHVVAKVRGVDSSYDVWLSQELHLSTGSTRSTWGCAWARSARVP
nr:protocadherin alpha-3-like [Chlorocebus sabaeus]